MIYDGTLNEEMIIKRASQVENLFRFIDGEFHNTNHLEAEEKEGLTYLNPWRHIPNEKYESYTADRVTNVVCELHSTISNDAVTKAIRKEYRDRVGHGLKKYGTTVQGNPLLADQWARHHYEELLDASVYTARRISDMRIAGVSVDNHNFQWLCNHLMSLTYDVRVVRNQMKEIEFNMLQSDIRASNTAGGLNIKQTDIQKKWISKKALEGHPNLFDDDGEDSP